MLPRRLSENRKKDEETTVTATVETEQIVPANAKSGCICVNQSKPDANGNRMIDPSCRVHYAELVLRSVAFDPETEITEKEIAQWQRREKKRVCYPKMSVAKR